MVVSLESLRLDGQVVGPNRKIGHCVGTGVCSCRRDNYAGFGISRIYGSSCDDCSAGIRNCTCDRSVTALSEKKGCNGKKREQQQLSGVITHLRPPPRSRRVTHEGRRAPTA